MALPSIVSGNRTSFDDQDDHILDIEKGIKFLNPRDNGIKFIKRLISNRGDTVAKSFKHEWNETALPVRRETVTFADGSGTSVTVGSAYGYQVNDLLQIESEIVRVTALASSTSLTVVRGYAGTTGAAHAAKTAYNLGAAAPENNTAPAGTTLNADRLYNYVQTFDRSVDMSTDEIAQLSAEMGNPMNVQLERITLYFWKLFAQAVFYGVRYEDTTNKIHVMGGVNQFLTTNVTNVAGALTVAGIDAQILAIVNAGGNPDLIVVSPTQKQKLDALDSNVVRTGKRNSDHVGGNPIVMTWQSGVLDYELDIIVDHTIKTDELYILDTNYIELIPLVNNGINGKLSVIDATTSGQDGSKKVLRAKYTLVFKLQGGMAKMYGLT
jgi:hypothetical protein